MKIYAGCDVLQKPVFSRTVEDVFVALKDVFQLSNMQYHIIWGLIMTVSLYKKLEKLEQIIQKQQP